MNTSKNFVDVEFFNRETEKLEILNILRVKPQLINFIYGPIKVPSEISNKFEMQE